MTDDIDNDGTTLHESGGVGLQGLREAFEAFYKRDANDPTSADLLSTFSLGWNACAALAASPLSDGWVSVEERLPKCDMRKRSLGVQVLIWPRHPNSDLGVMFYGRRQTDQPAFYMHGEVLHGVTHWQALPAPPTAESRSQS